MWRRQSSMETAVTTNVPEDTTEEEERLGAESPLSMLLTTTTMSPSFAALRSRSSSDETTNSTTTTTRRSSWFAPISSSSSSAVVQTEGEQQQQGGDYTQAQSSSSSRGGLSLMIPRRPSLRGNITTTTTTAARTLHAEIQKRDEMIASLTRTKLLLRKSLENLQEELLLVKRRSNMKLAAKNVELEATKNELTNVQSQLQQVLNDLQQQDDSSSSELLQNDDMAAGAPHNLSSDWPPHISDYITHLQQKLSSCMQKLKVLENHTSAIKQMHVEYAKSAQEDLVSINQERTLVEMEHLSKIDALEQEKRMSEQALLAKLEMKQVRIQHLEDMLDELRSQCIVMETTSNNNSSSPTSGRMTPTQQEVEAIVAVGELKEALEQMTRARDDLEISSNNQIRTLQAEMERLTIMNEIKQKKIDEYECQDALETLESDCVGEQIRRRWNERAETKKVVVMVEECNDDDNNETEEENGSNYSAASSSVPPPPPAKTPTATATSNDGEQQEDDDTNDDESQQQQHLSRAALTPLASDRKDTRNAGILSPTDPLAKMSESQRKLQVARLERYL